MANTAVALYHLENHAPDGGDPNDQPERRQETGELLPKHKVRFVTAAALFDGHDASINIMRRIIQSTGLRGDSPGHNRSVGEIVKAALQEDVQGIAITSYQGATSSSSST